MEDVQNTREAELREMVLSFAANMARELVPVIREAEMHSGVKEDTLEVEEIKWFLSVVYWRQSDTLRIHGHPTSDDVVGTHPLFRLFADNPEEDGSFDFRLPVAWLPENIGEEVKAHGA
jgi:hypothetical protein